MLSALTRSRIDRVFALFAPTPAAQAAERTLDDGISALIADFLRTPGVTAPADMTALAEGFCDTDLPDEPMDTADFVEHLAGGVVPYSDRIASPRCLAHMNQGLPYFMRPLAKLVTALNQNMTKLDASRALSLCERQALAAMHRLAYDFSNDFYDRHVQDSESTLGIVVSGGTLANLTALWAARNTALGPRGDFAGVESEGLAAALRHYEYHDAVVIGPDSMHYSFDKAACLLGLGRRGLVRVPTDECGRMDLDALQEAVATCQAHKTRVIALVGVAGSTDAGAIDPLVEIAELARDAGIHFHVDAAWGGPLLFSEEHRARLSGVGLADTITIDGHKQLYLPLGIGLVFFRDPHHARVIEENAQYLSRPGSADLGKRSLEGSRPGTALYLHAALRLIGRGGYATLVDENLRKARRMAELIRKRPDFELLMEPDSNLVLYRYRPADAFRGDGPTERDEALNRLNEQLHEAQRQAGRAYVSRTTLSRARRGCGVPVVALRAVVANPLTSEADLVAVLQDQQAIGAALEWGRSRGERP